MRTTMHIVKNKCSVILKHYKNVHGDLYSAVDNEGTKR